MSKVPVKGHIWYQGESDQSNKNFEKEFAALIESWRETWQDLTAPFIFVQLPRSGATVPNWGGGLDANGHPTSTLTFNYTDVHSWQYNAYKAMKNDGVYMAVTIDTTTVIDPQKSIENMDAEDPLHPWNKSPIAIRLGNIALNEIYGKKQIKHLFPMPESFFINGKYIKIKYSGVYDSLSTTDGEAPKHFEIIDSKGDYHSPDSISFLSADEIVLWSNSVSDVSGVAYFHEDHYVDTTKAFAPLAPTLVSSEGLPAAPFTYMLDGNEQSFVMEGMEFNVTFSDGDITHTRPITDTSVFPTASDLGMSETHFLGWTDGKQLYKSGTVMPINKINGKTLLPFYQDPSVPAMGFSYEADVNPRSTNKYAYTELLTDDGRTALHAHQFGTTWDKDGLKYKYDARIFLYTKGVGFDADQYNIVQYSYKLENGTTPKEAYAKTPPAKMSKEYLDETNGAFAKIFYYPEDSDTSYYALYGECCVGGEIKGLITDGEYHLVEIDMSNLQNGNTRGGEWTGRSIYGFAIDADKTALFGNDVYIDYIRVYRGGFSKVEYNTNAPDNAVVIKEVAPDLNRGVGVGYLLKDERPVVEGYRFMGWATTKDATEEQVVSTIDLTDDTEVYAVWVSEDKYVAPASTFEFSIKMAKSGDNGIRFKSTISNEEKTQLNSFGFIVTREALLPKLSDGSADTSALTFNLKKNEGVNADGFAVGIAYDKTAGIDNINSENENGDVAYTAVITGVPLSAKNENIYVRTFAKYNFADGEAVVYGNAVGNSLYNVASLIKNSGTEAYTSNKEYIDSVLAQ